MQEIDELIVKFLKDLDYPFILDMFDNIGTGKKLRSKLILNIAGFNENSYKLSAVIELIHLASLLHDDIIDDCKLRRGKKSINAEFGVKNALMLGDVLYSKAFYELTFFNNEISKIVSKAVVDLSIGELMDVKLSDSFNIDKDKYMNMIYKKTAVLIEASAKSAAILAGLSCEKFGEYGKNLGIAFQIIDDILDIKNSEDVLGKEAMNDFKEGKTTLAYMYLYEKLNENDRNALKSMFKKDLNEKDIIWIKEKMAEFNIINKVIDEAKNYGLSALNSIKEFNNNHLNDIVEKMINREF